MSGDDWDIYVVMTDGDEGPAFRHRRDAEAYAARQNAGRTGYGYFVAGMELLEGPYPEDSSTVVDRIAAREALSPKPAERTKWRMLDENGNEVEPEPW